MLPSSFSTAFWTFYLFLLVGSRCYCQTIYWWRGLCNNVDWDFSFSCL